MKYKTYYQLRKLAKSELWDIAINEGILDSKDIHLTKFYFSKGNLLELLSVTHREWVRTI